MTTWCPATTRALFSRRRIASSWVHGLLRARHAYAGLYDDLRYWAPTQGGVEVDFLVRRGKTFLAVEVKSTRNPGAAHVSGLRAIADLPGLSRRVLVHTGDRPFNTADGIEALPVMAFAQEVLDGAF
jgi:predicted AAA+ superfamily ATPase